MDQLSKDMLEEHRLNHVPRYLFRCWSYKSGGGPLVSVNNTTEIVPPAFVQDPTRQHRFYSHSKQFVIKMAMAHYEGLRFPLSEFSSWAASLHLVLCYAAFKGDEHTHIAIIDTQDLDDEVLVWHVPHLLKYGLHEYLAHGRIRGRGYTAVPFRNLTENGLYNLFPSLQKYNGGMFGYPLRVEEFQKSPKTPSNDELAIVRILAAQFRRHYIPFALALISSTCRPWFTEELAGGSSPSENVLTSIAQGLGISDMPKELCNERWLMTPGMVRTKLFPDVRQWIDLFRAMLLYINAQQRKKATIRQNTQIPPINLPLHAAPQAQQGHLKISTVKNSFKTKKRKHSQVTSKGQKSAPTTNKRSTMKHKKAKKTFTGNIQGQMQSWRDKGRLRGQQMAANFSYKI